MAPRQRTLSVFSSNCPVASTACKASEKSISGLPGSNNLQIFQKWWTLATISVLFWQIEYQFVIIKPKNGTLFVILYEFLGRVFLEKRGIFKVKYFPKAAENRSETNSINFFWYFSKSQ